MKLAKMQSGSINTSYQDARGKCTEIQEQIEKIKRRPKPLKPCGEAQRTFTRFRVKWLDREVEFKDRPCGVEEMADEAYRLFKNHKNEKLLEMEKIVYTEEFMR